jgi:hypothetical protein
MILNGDMSLTFTVCILFMLLKKVQDVRMKGNQNIIIISQKAFLYTFMGYTITKGNY